MPKWGLEDREHGIDFIGSYNWKVWEVMAPGINWSKVSNYIKTICFYLIFLSVHPSVCLSVHLSICLFLSVIHSNSLNHSLKLHLKLFLFIPHLRYKGLRLLVLKMNEYVRSTIHRIHAWGEESNRILRFCFWCS